jgi:hypothetical protein
MNVSGNAYSLRVEAANRSVVGSQILDLMLRKSVKTLILLGFIHGGVPERRPQRCSRQPLSWALPIGTRRRFPLWR